MPISQEMTELFILVIVGTTVWVAVDASGRDWRGNSFASSPALWALGTLLLWIVIFPVYLVSRGRAPRKQTTA
jgi:hypothetical protein